MVVSDSVLNNLIFATAICFIAYMAIKYRVPIKLFFHGPIKFILSVLPGKTKRDSKPDELN